MHTTANLTAGTTNAIKAHPRTIRPDPAPYSRALLRILIFGFRLQAYSRMAINWVRA
jgi:hypothetical protein